MLTYKKHIMDCQRPVKNEETGKWDVWDFDYEENGERYYERHQFWEFKDAIEFWKSRNPKQKQNTTWTKQNAAAKDV